MKARQELVTPFGGLNLLKEWEINHPVLVWSFIYSSFVILAGIYAAIFSSRFVSPVLIDNARYMLSALVQSQAAIIAILITLTLIATQLSASFYSPRIIDIFKRSPDMWILLSLYGFSIFFSLFILKYLESNTLEQIGNSSFILFGSLDLPVPLLINFSFFLGCSLFLALFIYINNTIELLKLENIVKMVAKKIEADDILNKTGWFQSLSEIITRSIQNTDCGALNIEMKALNHCFLQQMYENKVNEDQKWKISETYLKHILSYCRSSIRKDDEDSAIELIRATFFFGAIVIAKKDEEVVNEIHSVIVKIGKLAVEHGFSDLLLSIFTVIHDLGKEGADPAITTSRSIELIEYSCKRNLYAISPDIIEVIKGISDLAIKNESFAYLRSLVEAIDEIMEVSVNNDNTELVEATIYAYLDIGIELIDDEFDNMDELNPSEESDESEIFSYMYSLIEDRLHDNWELFEPTFIEYEVYAEYLSKSGFDPQKLDKYRFLKEYFEVDCYLPND